MGVGYEGPHNNVLLQFSITRNLCTLTVHFPVVGVCAANPTSECSRYKCIRHVVFRFSHLMSFVLGWYIYEVGATESTSQDPASKDGDDKWVSVTADEQGRPPNAQSCNWSKEAATLPSAQQQHDTHQQLALGIHLLTKQHSALISSVSISNVYLSPPIACGVCKLVAHNTSSVLVCDGCESAFHVACLQLYDDPMVIPRCDWYCPKCVGASGGRPQTPKYGPLRHGHNLQGSTHGSWGLQGAKSSEGSKEQVGEKSLLLYKKGIGGEVAQGTKEFVRMNLNSALASTKTTEAGAAERKLVVLEQRNGDCPAQCQITAASPTPPATQIHTETATKVTTTTSEAAPQVAVTFPAVEEETVMGGKCVTRKSSSVEWVGSVVNVSQGNVYYTACSVAGVTMRLQDCALFRPESPHDPPYIARLQALWEEKSTGAKWVKVNWCYYPSDLPVETGQPASADDNEVYESNHSDNNLVGSIHGPCQVLPPIQYQQEIERQSKETSEALPPVFLCRWFYDAPRGLFHACSGFPSDQLLRPAAETTP
ncbi:hypothetical protein BDL97_10G049800 [Sphagnum fallax]|nr:hypothetical protein BDL97_10G049800 [Sphagnum fallax]